MTLGVFAVRGRILLPSPAARMIDCMIDYRFLLVMRSHKNAL
jgi:hypothetical protein